MVNGAVREEFQGKQHSLMDRESAVDIRREKVPGFGLYCSWDAAKSRRTLRRGNVRDFEGLLGARTVEVWNCATNSGSSRK